MKPSVWIFSIEPLESRYTKQWHEHLPKIFASSLNNNFVIKQIDGIQKNTKTTPGAFLNFSDTNYWKSSQLCYFLDMFNSNQVGDHDHLIFTDAWNPAILQIKYMRDLLNKQWVLHGLWHAGSYDENDFLGRIIGNATWVRQTELAMFNSYDHNYFASNFHIDLFCKSFSETQDAEWRDQMIAQNKIIRSGWPMEYLVEELDPFVGENKENLIVFPHRIAPEKQLDIFLDLKQSLPQYKFEVCQERSLTKYEYHKILAKSKMVFSANLQETLGISWFEGLLVDSVPVVPDRLSYSEMANSYFKYPSEWTTNFSQYQKNKNRLIEYIIDRMDNYANSTGILAEQRSVLLKNYFSANKMYEIIQSYV